MFRSILINLVSKLHIQMAGS